MRYRKRKQEFTWAWDVVTVASLALSVYILFFSH